MNDPRISTMTAIVEQANQIIAGSLSMPGKIVGFRLNDMFRAVELDIEFQTVWGAHMEATTALPMQFCNPNGVAQEAVSSYLAHHMDDFTSATRRFDDEELPGEAPLEDIDQKPTLQ